ncbi:unnamed protein product [Clavelina lepadiformis]|uniref:PLAT domain-containing protein n=1 Tax=Clavelina lepadiformis TaxID=159417 RepID=A0ABP0GV33_CLALP
MDVTSKQVIDAVAAKIKYYMEVKRKEEGFDLSGPNEPKRTYPHLKTGPMLSNGKIHDRSLKHYFTPSMIRTQIANLDVVRPGSPRQKSVQHQLRRSMRNDKCSPFLNASMYQEMNDELYTAQVEALNILQQETQQRIRKKVNHGDPILRRTVSPKMTHSEAKRLVNRSSQILVATETVALAHDIIAQRHSTAGRPQSAPAAHSMSGLPGLYENGPRPRTARGRVDVRRPLSSTPKPNKRKPKYVWNINGRRIPYAEYEETVEDDPSSSYSTSSSSVGFESQYKCTRGHRRFKRPMSAVTYSNDTRIHRAHRPYSADNSQKQQQQPNARSDYPSRKAVTPDSGFSVNAETQTKSHRRSRERVKQAFVVSSETSSDNGNAWIQLRKYRIEIQTGDRLGAGTTADIYLSLHGDKCETDEIYLTNPVSTDGRHKPFRRGQVDVFEIEAENVGDLQKIGIGHDQKDKGHSWFVDNVTIKCEGHSWNFKCKTWLSGAFSRRLTFRYITLDHNASEISESDSDENSHHSESSSSISSRGNRKKIKSRKSSTSSDSSRSSIRSKQSSVKSASSASSMKKMLFQQLQQASVENHQEEDIEKKSVSTQGIVVDKTQQNVNDDKSSLEYSSDSTIGGKRSIKDDQSFVEESDDTVTNVTSDTDNESDTISTTSKESIKLAPSKSTSTLSKSSTSLASNSDDDFFETPQKHTVDGSLSSSLASLVGRKSEERRSTGFFETVNNSLFSNNKSSSSGSRRSSSSSESDKDPKRNHSPEIEKESPKQPDIVSVDEKTELALAEKKLVLSKDVSSSSSSSSSSSDSEDDQPPQHAPLRKQPSFAGSVSVDVESAKPVTSVALVAAAMETVPEPVREESEMTVHEVLTSPVNNDDLLQPPSRRSSTSSAHSNQSYSIFVDNKGELTIPDVSTFVKKAIIRTISSLSNGKSSALSASEDDGENEVKAEEETQSQSSSSSSSESSSSDEASKSSSGIPTKRMKRLSIAESIPINLETSKTIFSPSLEVAPVETVEEPLRGEIETQEHEVIAPSPSVSSRKASSSSSSSSDNEEEHGQTQGSVINEASTVDEDNMQAKEEADVFKGSFSAGEEAARRPSLTYPALADDESYKRHIDDSSGAREVDEEGTIASALHHFVRGDIHDLVEDGDLVKVTEIIKLRPDLKEQRNEKGWNPIHVAAAHGKLEILQWMSMNGFNLNAETPTGYTALHMAAMHDHVQCVTALHARGVDLDAINIDQQTSLHLAAMSGHLETTKWLVANRANIESRDLFQRTALDLARQYHHKEVAKFLKLRLREMKQQNSLMSGSVSSVVSSSESEHSSSSSEDDAQEEEERTSTIHDNPDASNDDHLAKLPTEDDLEQKKKIYDKQHKKMVRRKSSFLDAIRDEAEGIISLGSSSSSSSSSESDRDK